MNHFLACTVPTPETNLDTLKRCSNLLARVVAVGLLLSPQLLMAQPLQTLTGHVPTKLAGLHPVGVLPDSTLVDLIVGLPLQHSEEVQKTLEDLYDPGSSRFHRYLSPHDYLDTYAPTAASYQKVLDFAKANQLEIITTPPNRKFVHVRASAATINRVFHVTLRNYRHPTENRLFYAADVEPSVELDTPLSHVSGLDNFTLLSRLTNHYAAARKNAESPSPDSGSGHGGLFTGGDFRAAYAPGVTLTGKGQTVGIIEFEGYNPSDLSTYETTNGIPNVPLQNVYLDGYSGSTMNSESATDIELVLSMAPGLSKAVVYGAPYTNASVHDVLNELANPSHGEPLPYQITTSYWFFYDQNVYDSLTQLALQGQALFVASGDDGAYDETTGKGAFPPVDFPYVTTVGGTELRTSGPGGHLVSESAAGFSGGGYSPNAATDFHFEIPSYQFGMNLSAAHGSNFARNVPDVAIVADHISIYQGGQWRPFAGTSAAAPLWAGFMALANEQAANSGAPRIGFPNPALYAAGRNGACSNCFNDITVGDNFNEVSPNEYAAVRGYDLVTGWGSPQGANLINRLVSYGNVPAATIWRYTGTPCTTTCPGWQKLDGNAATVGIAASAGNLYQLHQRYTLGTPAATIWKFTGQPCSSTSCPGWVELDDNPATAAIVADGTSFYQLHNTGKIWRSTGIACGSSGCPGWQMLDDNPAAVGIAASGGNLYQLHNTGSIWKWLGSPCNGTVCLSWEMLDDNPAARAIVADGNALYELHDTGRVWQWTGASCEGSACFGWQMLDDNANTISIAASNGSLFELDSDGTIRQFLGTACSGSSCPSWLTIGSSAGTISIVADSGNLYRLRNSGIVEVYDGSPHAWTTLDNNALTTQIAAGGGSLYQLHGGR